MKSLMFLLTLLYLLLLAVARLTHGADATLTRKTAQNQKNFTASPTRKCGVLYLAPYSLDLEKTNNNTRLIGKQEQASAVRSTVNDPTS